MRTPLKVGAYGLGLAAVFAASVGIGTVGGPTGAAPAGHADSHPEQQAAALPGGLQVAQDGYRLVPLTTALSTGPAAPFRFRILGPDDAAVTRYTTSHDKDLHLIVVRRDLS